MIILATIIFSASQTCAHFGKITHNDNAQTFAIEFVRQTGSQNIWRLTLSVFEGYAYVGYPHNLGNLQNQDINDLIKTWTRENQDGSRLCNETLKCKFYLLEEYYRKLNVSKEFEASSNRHIVDEQRSGTNHSIQNFLQWIGYFITKIQVNKPASSDAIIDFWCRMTSGQDAFNVLKCQASGWSLWSGIWGANTIALPVNLSLRSFVAFFKTIFKFDITSWKRVYEAFPECRNIILIKRDLHRQAQEICRRLLNFEDISNDQTHIFERMLEAERLINDSQISEQNHFLEKHSISLL